MSAQYQYNPLGQIQAETTDAGTYYHHRDLIGSVTDLTDLTDTNGALQTSYSYTAFGEITQADTAAAPPTNPFTYTGEYREPTTSAAGYYLRACNYTPDTGRFTSQDPYNPGQGTPYGTAYGYVENAPTSRTDPSGMCSVWADVKDFFNRKVGTKSDCSKEDRKDAQKGGTTAAVKGSSDALSKDLVQQFGGAGAGVVDGMSFGAFSYLDPYAACLSQTGGYECGLWGTVLVLPQAARGLGPAGPWETTALSSTGWGMGGAAAGKSLSKSPGQIAAAFNVSVKAVKEAIHKVKNQGGWRGIGGNKNPDMKVDLRAGEVYPMLPNGEPSSEIIQQERKMMSQEMPSDNWASASFRVFSTELSALQIESAAGIRPDASGNMGEPVNSKRPMGFKNRHSFCVWESGEGNDSWPHQHVAALVTRLAARAEALKRLSAEGCELEIFIGFSSESGQGSCELPLPLLRQVVELGAGITLDLYPPASDEPVSVGAPAF